MIIPTPKPGDFVTFVSADGVYPSAKVLHVWERRDDSPPLLNLDAPGSPTSVPHQSDVVGATSFFWR